MEKLRMVGISGSLRKKSFNTSLLKTVKRLASPLFELELISLDQIPLYNGDVEAKGVPTSVQKLKMAIETADGLIFATPEYNHSISGVLKNAIDWASRKKPNNSFFEKPVAIMGASDGRFGTARAQLDLRKIMATLGAYVMPNPTLLISNSDEKFDEVSGLFDKQDLSQLQKLLDAFAQWVQMFKAHAKTHTT